MFKLKSAVIPIFLILSLLGGCAKKTPEKKVLPKPTMEKPIQLIQSMAEFKDAIALSGERLIAFDLYADWCIPCKYLTPTLEKLAKEHLDNFTIYKVDVDSLPDVAKRFRASGLPFVVFMKNQKEVQALLGLQPESAYREIIKKFS